jgi:HrpA-like RNA helicase
MESAPNVLPSLYSTGSIVPPKGTTRKERTRIENMRAIDYVLDFIGKRTPKGHLHPAVRAQRPGDRVICLKSGTGSGKSTVLPAELYGRFFDQTDGSILVTQPRVINAIDIVKQVTKHYDLQFGRNIGYQTGPLTRTPDMSGVLFATIGVLTNKLTVMPPENFLNYQYLVIDEVHDRSKDLDAALFMIKKLLGEFYMNPRCPLVILTSATFNHTSFMQYFGAPKINYIEVSGRTYPIDIRYPEFTINNYVAYAIDRIKFIHFNGIDMIDDPVRDIIVFVKSNSDSELIEEAMREFNSELLKKGFVEAKREFEGLPSVEARFKYEEKDGGALARTEADTNYYFVAPIKLSSATFGRVEREFKDLYAKRMRVVVEGRRFVASRKVIVSTPVAETGVTLETLKYCIDTGYRIAPEYVPAVDASLVKHTNVTQGMVAQRIGRVGRKAPGIAYPCYTRETYEMMMKDDFSQLIREDIAHMLLVLITAETAQLEDTESHAAQSNETFQMHRYSDKRHYYLKRTQLNMGAMDYIEQPSASGLVAALEKLNIAGFLIGHEVTPEGYFASKIQKLSIEVIKMIFAGYAYGANVLDLITIAAFLTVQRAFARGYTPRNPLKLKKESANYYAKVVWGCEFIDFLFVWDEFCDQLDRGSLRHLKKWARDEHIVLDALIKISDMRTSIIENMVQIGLDPYYNGSQLPPGSYSLRDIIQESLPDGMAEIVKIKKCLVEGFRTHMLTWNKRSETYVGIYRRIPVYIDSYLTEGRPHQILVGNLSLLETPTARGTYEFVGSVVSVLDEHVDVDLSLLT